MPGLWKRRFIRTLEFIAHNIRLDDGTFTKPDLTMSTKSNSASPMMVVWRGGYAVEFARIGFRVLGIEVRELNIAACKYIKSKTDLPDLEFA